MCSALRNDAPRLIDKVGKVVKPRGIVSVSHALTWDVDLYRIDFTNKYVSNGLGGTDAAYVNVGGATYQGVEGQATYLLGNGFALYANGSSNDTRAADTGKTISGSPDMTAALGVLFDKGPWAGSLLYKRTDAVYQSDYDASKPAAYQTHRTGGYTNKDLSIAYRIAHPGLNLRSLKLQLNVFNLLNKQEVTSISPGKTVAGDQYTFQAPRSFQVSMRAEF